MAISNLSSGFRPGVCTSTTRPSTPYEGQMIYETDTDKVLVWNGSAWYANWNLPWGYVADTTLATSTGYITGTQDVLSVTFTSVANRRYKYTVNGLLTFNASGNFSINFVDNSNNALREYFAYAPANGVYLHPFFNYIETISSSASTTRKVRHPGSGVQGVYYYGTSTRDQIAWKILVEDIGPA